MALALRYRGRRDGGADVLLGEGDVRNIPPEGLVLGRGVDADIRVPSGTVARKHVRIAYTDGAELVAVDLGSTNGTAVNGIPGHEHRLRPGDVITVAGFFDFEVVEVP